MSDAPDWTVPLTIVDGATLPGADFPDWTEAVTIDGSGGGPDSWIFGGEPTVTVTDTTPVSSFNFTWSAGGTDILPLNGGFRIVNPGVYMLGTTLNLPNGLPASGAAPDRLVIAGGPIIGAALLGYVWQFVTAGITITSEGVFGQFVTGPAQLYVADATVVPVTFGFQVKLYAPAASSVDLQLFVSLAKVQNL